MSKNISCQHGRVQVLSSVIRLSEDFLMMGYWNLLSSPENLKTCSIFLIKHTDNLQQWFFCEVHLPHS